MSRITQPTRLERVDYILGSGTGVLDFALQGESSYATWEGDEEVDWEIDDVSHVENAEEDRFIIYPRGEHFVCEIRIGTEEESTGSVRCWCE